MATQHPDNASAPFWDKKGNGFVSIYEELPEAMTCFRELGVDEFMWDYEGKYADEAVMDKLFSHYHGYFEKTLLGKEKFLTFRLPNVWQERGYSLIRALMVILTSEDFAGDLGFHSPPLFEVILPMTENAKQLLYIQKSFRELARFKYRTFSHKRVSNSELIEMIPLVESVESQMEIGHLLYEYAKLHKKNFKKNPVYIRPFLARSDPSLVSGLLATVLANKIALSEISNFSKKTGIKTYPILGAGSLIFRGGLSPDRMKVFVKEYGGISTITMQSAFRYDYPLNKVKKCVEFLSRTLRKTKAQRMTEAETKELKKMVGRFARAYQSALFPVTQDLEGIFAAVPRRRERRLHIGLLGYNRKSGKLNLPRAINFTAAFYSIGIPPEFIGLGRVLKDMSPAEIKLLKKFYVNFSYDLKQAGRYLNRENLLILSKDGRKESVGWQKILEDVLEMERVLGTVFSPKTLSELEHRNLSSNTLLLRKNPELVSKLITETGVLRKSLG